MSDIITPSHFRCPGPVSRRSFMQIGLAGMASLSLPGLMRLRAENALKPLSERKSIIMVWLPGGLLSLGDRFRKAPAAKGDAR